MAFPTPSPVPSVGNPNSTPSPPDPHPYPPESFSEADGDGDEEEEEEEECGFCLFMKGGGCKDSFIAWEKCVEDAEKVGEDIVDRCFEVTSLLNKCMEAHADYYAPVLAVEQAVADAADAEMQKIREESRESSQPEN